MKPTITPEHHGTAQTIFDEFNELYRGRFPQYRLDLMEVQEVSYFKEGKISMFGDYRDDRKTCAEKMLQLQMNGKTPWVSRTCFQPVIRNLSSEESATKPVYLRVYPDGKIYCNGYKRFKAAANRFLAQRVANHDQLSVLINRMSTVDNRSVSTSHEFTYSGGTTQKFKNIEDGLRHMNKNNLPIVKYELVHDLIKTK